MSMKAPIGFLSAAALAAAILSAPLALAAGTTPTHAAVFMKQAIAAASSMGVTPPSEPTPKEQRIYQHLASLSGAKFDKAFVKAMVKDHKQDIAKYTEEAKATNSPASNYAETVLPDLHKHLRIAESLQRSPGG
jgi:predicted outer membrane protein